jgi:putative Mg2+ transporter-C (MgtC) family protein
VSNIDQLEFFGWIVLALALGSIVGLEREYRGHEAGVRTNGLVAAASASFGLISFRVTGEDRIAAGVVQGVGFLGAGLVFHNRQSVMGATTAATIWLVAALGLLVSAELWLTAILVTAAVIVLLELLPFSNMVYQRGLERSAQQRRRAPPPGSRDA